MIVQNDFHIFLELEDPLYEEKKGFLALFSHLEKSPEYIHTYKITELSLWNAASRGIEFNFIEKYLNLYTRYPLRDSFFSHLRNIYSRHGQIILEDCKKDKDSYYVKVPERFRTTLKHHKKFQNLLVQEEKDGFYIHKNHRGIIKKAFLSLDPPYPIEDRANLKEGESIHIHLKGNWEIRDYQKESVQIFLQTGFGAIVLPCGAGKTIVGLEALCQVQQHTLIIVPHFSALKQWRKEILNRTTWNESELGEYTSVKKNIQPITLTTYQILSHRDPQGEFKHFSLFRDHPWGLVIYDEVHILPAPVFRVVAEIQSTRRLGLTATLVREDHLEGEVFSLIGPKRYDLPWKEVEHKGFIAPVICTECRLNLSSEDEHYYWESPKRQKAKIAATNLRKNIVVQELIQKHHSSKILVIGQYISQLQILANLLKVPFLMGKVNQAIREQTYEDFRTGKVKCLVVSKIANLALDLPDASVLIQVSGAFGSRQEEAQRLGRILRPQINKQAYFYTLVSQGTVEEEFSYHRQLFLIEQGYRYDVQQWD